MGYGKDRPFVKVDVTGEVDSRFDEVTSQLAEIVDNNAIVVRPSGNDDTVLINNTITAVSNSVRLKKIILDGEFTVSAPSDFSSVIAMKSNVVLEFTPGSKLILSPNSFDGYYIILCNSISNFEIIDPYIVGDRDGHTGTTGEYGHGIGINGCTDFKIYNVYAEKCWGDGVCIVGSLSGVMTENGYISSIKSYKCRRNGTTISSGINLKIDYIEGIEIDGILPMSALDIEANTTGEVWENIEIGEVKSVNCPNGVLIDPRTLATYSYVSNVDVSIKSIDIRGATPASTGRLTINTADHTKVKGRVNIGSLYVSKNLRGLYLSEFRKGGLTVTIDLVDLVTDTTGHTGSLSTNTAIFASVGTNFRTTNNLGSIYIDKLRITGDAAYSISLQAQNGGTFEKSEFVIGKFINTLDIPMYIEGRVHNMVKDDTKPMEVNVIDRELTYKTDTDWYNAHFISTLYHNENQTKDIVLRPLSFYGVINTPITVEIREPKLIILNFTGINITPNTLQMSFTNGFKSNTIGSKITYKYNDDGTITILNIIGTWSSYS